MTFKIPIKNQQKLLIVLQKNVNLLPIYKKIINFLKITKNISPFWISIKITQKLEYIIQKRLSRIGKLGFLSFFCTIYEKNAKNLLQSAQMQKLQHRKTVKYIIMKKNLSKNYKKCLEDDMRQLLSNLNKNSRGR